VIGLGIVGVVGVGAGMVLGLVASAKNKDSKGHCDPADETRCSDQGVSLRNEAYTFSDLSSVGFIAGGAALLGSGLLWLLDGSSETPDREAASVAVQAGPRAANLIVQGKF
jgi:hypothetical protein